MQRLFLLATSLMREVTLAEEKQFVCRGAGRVLVMNVPPCGRKIRNDG